MRSSTLLLLLVVLGPLVCTARPCNKGSVGKHDASDTKQLKPEQVKKIVKRESQFDDMDAVNEQPADEMNKDDEHKTEFVSETIEPEEEIVAPEDLAQNDKEMEEIKKSISKDLEQESDLEDEDFIESEDDDVMIAASTNLKTATELKDYGLQDYDNVQTQENTESKLRPDLEMAFQEEDEEEEKEAVENWETPSDTEEEIFKSKLEEEKVISRRDLEIDSSDSDPILSNAEDEHEHEIEDEEHLPEDDTETDKEVISDDIEPKQNIMQDKNSKDAAKESEEHDSENEELIKRETEDETDDDENTLPALNKEEAEKDISEEVAEENLEEEDDVADTKTPSEEQISEEESYIDEQPATGEEHFEDGTAKRDVQNPKEETLKQKTADKKQKQNPAGYFGL